MENLKLTQRAVGEFRIETPSDFCINSFENSAILGSNGNQFYILDLLYSCDMLNNVPFHIRNAQIQQHKPIVNLVKHVDYTVIYENCSVMESQELALDPIYTSECAIEAPKAHLLKADFLPDSSQTPGLCCVLTSYGSCDLMQQDPISLEWNYIESNLNQLLVKEIFPINKSPSNIKNFSALRKYVETYYITTFASGLGNIIYLGMAGGQVIVLKYEANQKEFKFITKLQTTLGRIAYMKTKNNLLLIACSQGQVCLLKFEEDSKTLRQMDFLWSKKDRMACRRALITYDDILQNYLVVFSKAAHILVYRLDSEGSIMANSIAHVKGIKISGLESISNTEIIASTIIGCIHLLTITFPSPQSLKIAVHPVKHDMDIVNFQILDVACTKSRNLWYFLLYHNKDYTHQSKYNAATAFLAICKSSAHNSLTILSNLNVNVMNTAQDLLLAINIDINNNIDLERYMNFMDFKHLKCPEELKDDFIQQLQKKYTIIRQIATYQQMKIKCVKRFIAAEKVFLESVLQIFHILQRLQYLHSISTMGKNVQFSEFQKLSILCMQTKCSFLIKSLKNTASADNGGGDVTDNPFEEIEDEFTNKLLNIYENYKFDLTNFQITQEQCSMCNEVINSEINFEKCSNEHDIKRCSISYLQLPLFSNKYCPNCYVLVANDDTMDLLQLFSTNEVIKCTFCRYMFKTDIY